MFALTLISSLSLLTLKLHTPLTNLLQSKYVSEVTLAYSNESANVAQAASRTIENAHQYWCTINIDRGGVEPINYHYKALYPISVAQFRNFVILTLEVSRNVTKRMTFCFGLILCSYLVLVETNGSLDHNYLHKLIVDLRSSDIIHYVALLLYSMDVAEKVRVCFIANNGELIVFDHFDNLDEVYDRVFKDQYKLFRNSQTMNMYAREFSPDIYKIKPNGAVTSEEIYVGGSYVYLANMIGRYFDAKVKFFMRDVLKNKKPEYKEWVVSHIENENRIVTEEILPLSYIENKYDS